MKIVEIEKKIIKMVEEQLAIDSTDIKNSSLLVKDLGADSLDVIELIMGIEEDFGIDIPDSDVEKFGDDISIKDLALVVQSKIKQKG